MMPHMQAPPAPKPQQQAPLPPQQQQQQQAAGGEPEVIRNLMVNYIPTTIDEVQLRQLFEMYGPVESVKIVVDRDTRTSKGYGFVKFRFSFSAVHAIQYLNGYPLMNKRLKVAYSNQSEAQKMIVTQAPGAEAPYPAYPAPGGGEDNHQAWATQMSYMQQIAALQMMHQYQSAVPQQHHAHHAHQHQHQQRHHHHHHHHGHHHHQHHHGHHHHHHHHPQQPQQPQQAQDGKQ